MSHARGDDGRVRIDDVAALAGVSKGTVSHVLNHPDRVAVATRGRVEAAISELGFVPHATARSLATGTAPIVGAVLSDLSNSFFTDILAGIESVADEREAFVLAADSRQSLSRELRYVGMFESARALGTLLSLNSEQQYEGVRHEAARKRPLVLLNHRADPAHFCSVHADNVRGGGLVARHLLETGRTRLALVYGLRMLPPVDERVRGFEVELASHGLTIARTVEVPNLRRASGWAAGGELAEAVRSGEIDAVFAVSDLLAAGLVQSLVEAGVAVPEDVAVVGYDDNQAARDTPRPLTTVRQGGRAIGAVGAGLLFEEIDDPAHEHRAVDIAPTLVIRGTTA
ncbi:LacI family DNA-binding transcriptional regulator [Demequina sp. NBRC 110054]|uniref:LacI family DNA-binding transcriptional regulator n=1 Tax=Demequina sp. NBRC 110054 TaxID=1570343 RepID=UPI000A051E88|nr:LacI family DNA-binding transcriptional regulator [Demequina sp. NBRC 110054]